MSFLDSTYLNYKEDQNIKSYLTYRTLIRADEGKYLVGNIYVIISSIIEDDNMELYYDLIPDSIYIEDQQNGNIGLCAKDYLNNDIQIFSTVDVSLTDSYFMMQLVGIGQVIPEWIVENEKVKITLKWFDKTYTFITDHPKMIKEVQDFFEEYDELQSQLDKLVIYV